MEHTIECFKCDGLGRIEAFRHIENGTCYQCGGTGVEAAGKAGQDVEVTGPAKPHKTVDTPEQGRALITTYGTGYRATFENGVLHFDVVDKTIVLWDNEARTAKTRAYREALQAALKVTA